MKTLRWVGWIVLVGAVLQGAAGYRRKYVPDEEGFKGGVNPQIEEAARGYGQPLRSSEDRRRVEGYKPYAGGFKADMPGLGTSRSRDYLPPQDPKLSKKNSPYGDPKFGDAEAELPDVPSAWGLDHYLIFLSNLKGDVQPLRVQITEKKTAGLLDFFDMIVGSFEGYRSLEGSAQKRNHDEKIVSASKFRKAMVDHAWKERQKAGASPLEVFLGFLNANVQRGEQRQLLESISMVRMQNQILPPEWKLRIVSIFLEANKSMRLKMPAIIDEEEYGEFAGQGISDFLENMLKLMQGIFAPSSEASSKSESSKNKTENAKLSESQKAGISSGGASQQNMRGGGGGGGGRYPYGARGAPRGGIGSGYGYRRPAAGQPGQATAQGRPAFRPADGKGPPPGMKKIKVKKGTYSKTDL